jgi:hypothetical protein
MINAIELHPDPADGYRENLDLEDAIEIAREDAGLLFNPVIKLLTDDGVHRLILCIDRGADSDEYRWYDMDDDFSDTEVSGESIESAMNAADIAWGEWEKMS